MGFVQEFKEFALKGNVMDMAVGIVIGAAFNKVVTSLVNDIVMPPIGLLIAGVPFKELAWKLNDPPPGPDGKAVDAVAIHYGTFINTVLEFLIVALSVFVAIKVMNRLMRRRRVEAAK